MPHTFAFYSPMLEMVGATVGLAVCLLLFGTLLRGFAGNLSGRIGGPPYRRGRFLSVNEKRFLAVLDEVLGDRFRVFAQVRMVELVDVDSRFNGARKKAALNKVFGKSVDFVVCDAASLDPVGVIEVDDRTHLLAGRRDRDAFVNAVFEEIGLPLVRVKARGNYSAEYVREVLAGAAVARNFGGAA